MIAHFKAAKQKSDIYVERDIRYKVKEFVDLNRKSISSF